ncbi:MAG TPA: hypothetical protein VIU40_02165 [Geobacteraceae bacterium]
MIIIRFSFARKVREVTAEANVAFFFMKVKNLCEGPRSVIFIVQKALFYAFFVLTPPLPARPDCCINKAFLLLWDAHAGKPTKPKKREDV